MILLDTNVVSEVTRANPNAAAQAWLDSQDRQDLFLCAPVVAELRYGVERLAPGRRRDLLDYAIQQIVTEEFRDRILPLDYEAAHAFGRLVAAGDRLGRPIGTMDGLIAAIALAHDATIATHDVTGFADFGVSVVDPFEATT